MFLQLSFRCYRWILLSLYTAIYNHLGVNAFTVPARTILSLLLSLVFSLPLILSADTPWVWWILGLSCVHGLVVGIRWDQLESPDGLQLGVET